MNKHLIESKTGKLFCNESECWNEYHIPRNKKDHCIYIARNGKVIANHRNCFAYIVDYVKLNN